jgi:hypothetical protein
MRHYYSHMGHISGSHDEMWLIFRSFHDKPSEVIDGDGTARSP